MEIKGPDDIKRGPKALVANRNFKRVLIVKQMRINAPGLLLCANDTSSVPSR